MFFPYPSLDGSYYLWYSPIVGTTLNFLHPISRVDCPIISHYQTPPLSFLDVCRLAMQGPFMDLVGLLVKVKNHHTTLLLPIPITKW